MRVVIAGYGNSFRQDDRVGHELAPRVSDWLESRGVETELHLEQQLLPEMVYDLDGVDAAVFVDAHAQELDGGFRLETVAPDDTPSSANLHIMSPGRLLSLMGQVGLTPPGEAYLLTVSGQGFDFAEELTPVCRRRVEAAFDRFTAWWPTRS